VRDPESVEPVGRECEILGDDAEPTTPGAEDLELFERVRVGYGIEE
jgi:hypothetical protein